MILSTNDIIGKFNTFVTKSLYSGVMPFPALSADFMDSANYQERGKNARERR